MIEPTWDKKSLAETMRAIFNTKKVNHAELVKLRQLAHEAYQLRDVLYTGSAAMVIYEMLQSDLTPEEIIKSIVPVSLNVKARRYEKEEYGDTRSAD